MDKNTGTKTAESEMPFPRLELWEDGSRIPELYKPENFEWWYFDAQLTDGRTLVLVFYIDQDASERRFVYRAEAAVASPNGQRVAHTSLTRMCQFPKSDPKTTLAKVSSAAISTPTTSSWTRVISAS